MLGKKGRKLSGRKLPGLGFPGASEKSGDKADASAYPVGHHGDPDT